MFQFVKCPFGGYDILYTDINNPYILLSFCQKLATFHWFGNSIKNIRDGKFIVIYQIENYFLSWSFN